MEIIHDAYNKNMKCPNCESTFRYNEKDIESIFPCPEMAEKGIEGLKKLQDLAMLSTIKAKRYTVLFAAQ